MDNEADEYLKTNMSTKFGNELSLELEDVLDRTLNFIYSFDQLPTFETIYKSVFGNAHGEILLKLQDIAIDELIEKGYIISLADRNFKVTFKGIKFLKSPRIFYKYRPYKYSVFVEKTSLLWKIVSIIAVVLNSLAIIYLTALQVLVKP